VTLTVHARAPRRALPQTMAVAWNDDVRGTAPLTSDWADSVWTAPRAITRAGENRLCLRFTSAAPGESEQVAAAVSTVAVRID
jgi:hypothetical protein